MKIKKQIITESVLTEEAELLEDITAEDTAEDVETEDMIVDDVLSASVSEIADAVQTAKEEESDEEETYTDEKAKEIAVELKTAAKGLDRAKWAPLDVPNALTDALDKCLASAMIAQKSNRRDGSDMLVRGLPGSGKTGIVKQWAKARGVNLFELDSNDDELSAVLKGFPVDIVKKGKDGEDYHAVIKSFSSILDSLDDPMSVLFLDEFNRAPQGLRANLLKLINGHEVPGQGKNGRRRFDNLLFTIACINPAADSDPGVIPLNDAEKSRFMRKKQWDSKADPASKYLNFYISETTDLLDPSDEDYPFLYMFHKRAYNIAMKLVTDHRFEFDTEDDLPDLDDDRFTMLNQRSLTDGLMAEGGYGKDSFLEWVDEESGFLQKNIAMIHDILDGWVEPQVQPPTSRTKDIKSNDSSISKSDDTANDNSNKPAAFGDADDFESVIGSGGTETDSDLFGNTASAAGHAAKVGANDALNRIKNFDFSI